MSLVRAQQGEPKTQANAFRVALGFFVVLAELGPDDRVIRNVFFAGRRTAKKTCTLKPREALGKDARWFEPSRGSHEKATQKGGFLRGSLTKDMNVQVCESKLEEVHMLLNHKRLFYILPLYHS